MTDAVRKMVSEAAKHLNSTLEALNEVVELPTDAADLGIVVGEHIGGVRPALIQMPGL